jgi:Tfp pilus assembly protein PilN
MRAINLLPEQKRLDREATGGGGRLRTTTVLAVAGVLLAALVVLLGFAYMQGHSTVSKRRDTLHGLESQVAVAEGRQAAVQAAATASANEQSAVQSRMATFQTVASSRIAWDVLLDDLSRVLPNGSWISNVSVSAAPAPVATDSSSTTTTTTTSTTTTPTPAPLSTLQITGTALSNDVVARVLDRLALVPMLGDVNLEQTQQANVGRTPAYQFTLNASLVSSGMPQ